MARSRTANLLSFAFAATVTLFGLVLGILGASWTIAGAFFAAGLILLLSWRPQLELYSTAGTAVPPPRA